jgi:hypothetical protein
LRAGGIGKRLHQAQRCVGHRHRFPKEANERIDVADAFLGCLGESAAQMTKVMEQVATLFQHAAGAAGEVPRQASLGSASFRIEPSSRRFCRIPA